MSSASLDPLDVAGRVVQLLETGRRESTYKPATVMALVDICVENTPAPDGSLAVPIDEIAHRIVAYYWRQVRPFQQHGPLTQVKRGRSMPDRIAETRNVLIGEGLRTAEAARDASQPAYHALVRSLRQTVAQQPLTHLQTVPHTRIRDDFLFDASAFHKKMTVADVDRVAMIVLRPGVHEGLRRTSTLLRTFLRSLWAQDVIALNRAELDAEDLDGFLFGADRAALRALVDPLRDLQRDRCFYCATRMRDNVQIDHVVPWSLVPIDGVANLVAADARCNVDKSASAPARIHVERALDRTHLDDVAAAAQMPVLFRRTASAAEGMYGSLPIGSLLWRQVKDYELHTG
ncbi:HNH endonuclease [Rhodococcus ruber]|uniref:HNH endonuclease n=1 Tax=Rhodococcus TaxID=1827 RepID=UPI000E6AF65E|nr:MULTISPECIES: HNH endonuclease domain-containing protein [Rhodococcus]UQB74514.1 HNH endonuclease [Rhodococcus ruber]WML64566.1 HNH endonuclease domain-containing protein [Rhodococcus sp. AH-ZY2]